MIAELLTVERSEPMRELLASYPFKPYSWAAGRSEPGALIDYLLAGVGRAVESGGIARTYCAGGQVIGLCVTELDEWGSRELGRRTARISHLMALGRPAIQLIVKQLMLRETLRDTPAGTFLVARVPYVDLTSINALESCGFVATQTSMVLARDLAESLPDSTSLDHYDIHVARPDDVNRLDNEAFGIPDGILGWDARLPHATASRVHRDWLMAYAHEQRLLLACDHGQPVGLLAEHIRTETEPALGFRVGSIDLVTTVSEYRNNGVATNLVGRTLTAFRDEGARLAELTVHSADTPVIHSYQSQGFVTVGSSLTLVNRRT